MVEYTPLTPFLQKGSQFLIMTWYKIKTHSSYHGVVFKSCGYKKVPITFNEILMNAKYITTVAIVYQ